ncbi:MAG TPA: hypothetical protein PKD83_14070 [Ignavibacteria bacterium]|nr:hypothetical protein [Ignavibacteria bacterium]
MDFEKIKKDFNWDPSQGDYSKNQVSYERSVQKKKDKRSVFMIALYVILLLAVVVLVYLKIESLE